MCCRVILSRHQIAFAAWRAPLLGCVERSSPKAACGAPKGAGLNGEGAVRAIIIVAATCKGHSALFEALWIATVVASPFTKHELKSGSTDPRGVRHRAQKSRHNLVFGRFVCGSHHDAVMRIVGEAPGRRAQSSQRHLKPWVLRRDTATSDWSAALACGCQTVCPIVALLPCRRS